MSLEQSIKLAVESLGAKLYDIVTTKEHDRNIFRVLVTAEGGISLDKCAEISRMISPILDVDEPMNGEYILEVSSPGIERKLKNKDHFKASIGEKVKIKNFATEVFKGELICADNEKIVVKTEFGEDEITYDNILAAATYYEW
ncbi:ribosome maturation factor RimP [Arcobacter sp. s6]|jgi:ribosome maturation factor RimP|uniref:ribosome maturation factor RimP n=1 Tax=Arcobacter sp. s6 TaxID=3230363 RepID=UPI0034A021FA